MELLRRVCFVRLSLVWSVVFMMGSDLPAAKKPAKSWGLYQIYWNAATAGVQLDHAIETLQASPDYVLFFRDLHPKRGFPKAACRMIWSRGATPVISLELERWGGGPLHAATDILSEIRKGTYDAFFQKWGEQALSDIPTEKRVILRFGFEMNGDWFPWGDQPEAFVESWKRAYRIIESSAREAADRVDWMWSPNILWDQRSPERDLYPYYPGHAVVDLVGLDGYNFGDDHDQWHQWESYESVFGRSIAAMEPYIAAGKPLFLAEIGCADDPRKSAWLEDFFEKFCADDRLSGFIYFNYDKRGENEHDWRLSSDPESLSVSREWLSRLFPAN